jgi:SAM-dependent methyltransferase/glycosyltransferase involved in cell wall biosynthesis
MNDLGANQTAGHQKGTSGFSPKNDPEESSGSIPKSKGNGDPLKVLFAQEVPCIRNYKMATALRTLGHHVTLAYTKAKLSQMYKGLDDGVYNECIQLKDIRQLWDVAKNYDIIHCHNEPDVLTVAALAAGRPVVHDTHDLASLHSGGDSSLAFFEGVANRGAHGRVYSTPFQQEEARKMYGVDGPSLVLYNYTSQGDLPRHFHSKRSAHDGAFHFVYEGGVGDNPHRDLSRFLTSLAQNGVHVHIYPTVYRQDMADFFGPLPNIHYNQSMSPKEIMTEMTQYDAGIIPFNVVNGSKRFLDLTVANKLFEYLAAGLPVITSRLKSYQDFFQQNPVGLTYETVEEILESIPKLNAIAKGTDFSKQVYTFESEATRLEDFYRQVLENHQHRKNGKNIGKPEEPNEAAAARDYWKTQELSEHYFQEGKQSAAIVSAVRELRRIENIASAFEFGCNVGRNLFCLQRDVDGLDVRGLDINETAVNAGRRRYQLPLFVGGEEDLSKMDNDSFDVSFTVSVLDHVPEAKPILKELLRITRKFFIALEPYVGVDKNAKEQAARGYSYFWDYPRLFGELGAEIVHNQHFPLSDKGLGPYYYLYIVRPAGAQS